jgi:hypothetical protein
VQQVSETQGRFGRAGWGRLRRRNVIWGSQAAKNAIRGPAGVEGGAVRGGRIRGGGSRGPVVCRVADSRAVGGCRRWSRIEGWADSPVRPTLESLRESSAFSVVPAEEPGAIRRSQPRGHGVWVSAFALRHTHISMGPSC